MTQILGKNEEIKSMKIEVENVKELVHLEEEKSKWYKNQIARKDTIVGSEICNFIDTHT